MKTELLRERNSRFLLNKLGDPHFLLQKFKRHTVEFNISPLRYCYLNAEKNTSLGTAGYVRSPQIL